MNADRLSHLHIICYRWGDAYGSDDVNILHAMVQRHLNVAHTFHCLTDDATGLRDDIVVYQLPDDHFHGNWNKLMTFQADFLGLSNQHVVCMDLDLVIVDSIDFLADRPACDFLIAPNWSRSVGVRGNSSVYRLRVGSHTSVWDRFIADPEAVISHHHGKTRASGDQRWINHAIDNFAFFPEEKIVSFKRQCGAKSRLAALSRQVGIPAPALGQARAPKDCAIVAFHGSPLPPDVRDGSYEQWKHAPFVAEHWHE